MLMNLLTVPLMASAAYGMTIGEAHKTIREEVAQYKGERMAGKDLCDQYSCCETQKDACNLSDMPQDQTSLILPGGESRCIFTDSTPYAAQVIPGDKDKLLVYFQGGGACWDETSTKLKFCTTDASPSGLSGIFNRDDPKNAHKDYTVVQMLYCSGDVFGGNVTQAYEDSSGNLVKQMGLTNVQMTLDWIVAQQKSGELAPKLADLVVAGCSAGSLGAQLWGNQVVNQLSWEKASVMPDSYAGLFAPGVEGPLIKNYGFCSSGFLNQANYEACMAGNVQMRDIEAQFLGDRPDVAYAYIQSKTDSVQESFYVATAESMGSDPAITPTTFYEGITEIFEGYNAFPNFVTYLVDGSQHCFTPSSVYYSADAMGPKDDGSSNSGPVMVDWVGASIPLTEGKAINTVCEGATATSDKKGVAIGDDNTYCSAGLVDKTYTEHY
jgi:hypothetical protein